MYCPQCGSEYVEGVTSCPECSGDLVEERQPTPAEPEIEPVVVLSSTDADQLAIAKSILLSEKIVFGVRGEEVQDLFALGRFPTGSSIFAGPIELVVAPADAIDARAALYDLVHGDDSASVLEAEDAGIPTVSRFRRFAVMGGKVIAVLMLGSLLFQLLSGLFSVSGG